MMKLSRFFAAILTSFFAARAAHAQQPKAIFYMTREPQSVHSFLAHADKIDILSPNWYSMDSSGLVSGGPNPQVLTQRCEFYFWLCRSWQFSTQRTASIRTSAF